MNESIKLMARNKVTLLMLSLTLIVGGISAQAAGILNSETGGYLVCVNSKTKVITHPGKTKCPKGSKMLVLGAQGSPGITGATGLSGKDGRDGIDGKTLWNGVTDPDNSWGAPGDMFINSVTKTLFGPKNLDGTWPVGVSMVGPQGERGPIGLIGATGAQGPSGPAGPAGATGAAGANATLTCAQGGTCVLGDRGPGGGIVFYIRTATPTVPWRYLEVAPATWFNGVADPAIAWCSNTNDLIMNPADGTSSVQQTQSAVGTGLSNTLKMLKVCTFGAATAISTYNGGGKSDWFLPSKDELNEMYLAKTLIGDFSITNWYWSSYENNFGSSWYQRMSDGFQTGYNKVGISAYVRPIRAF
jgi:hypothetical protein